MWAGKHLGRQPTWGPKHAGLASMWPGTRVRVPGQGSS